MTQTTSGIEPVFLPCLQAQAQGQSGDEDVKIDFVDEVGDAFEEYIVYHHKFLEWMRVNGIEVKRNLSAEEIERLVEKSPTTRLRATMSTGWRKSVCRVLCRNG